MEKTTCGATGEADDAEVLRLWRLLTEQTSAHQKRALLRQSPEDLNDKHTYDWLLKMILPRGLEGKEKTHLDVM